MTEYTPNSEIAVLHAENSFSLEVVEITIRLLNTQPRVQIFARGCVDLASMYLEFSNNLNASQYQQ